MIPLETQKQETSTMTPNQKMTQDFIEYVYFFYGPGGLYDLGFTVGMDDIARATAIRIRANQHIPFDGDSSDREIVRDIMTEMKKPIPDLLKKDEAYKIVFA